MFNIGYQEMLFIAVVALLVLGPNRLPEFFRQIGKVTTMLRRTVNEFRTEIEKADLRREGLHRIEPKTLEEIPENAVDRPEKIPPPVEAGFPGASANRDDERPKL